MIYPNSLEELATYVEKGKNVFFFTADVYAEEQLLGAPIATWIQRSGNQEEVRVSEKEW